MGKHLYIISALLIILLSIVFVHQSDLHSQEQEFFIGFYRYTEPTEKMSVIVQIKENNRYNISFGTEFFDGVYEIVRNENGVAEKLLLLRPESLSGSDEYVEVSLGKDHIIILDEEQNIKLTKFDKTDQVLKEGERYLGEYIHISQSENITVEMRLTLKMDQTYVLTFGDIPLSGYFREVIGDNGELNLVLEMPNAIYENNTILANVYNDYLILINPFTNERFEFMNVKKELYPPETAVTEEYKSYYGEYALEGNPSLIYVKINSDNTYTINLMGDEFESTYREEYRDGDIILVLENPEEYADEPGEIECIVKDNSLVLMDEFGDIILTRLSNFDMKKDDSTTSYDYSSDDSKIDTTGEKTDESIMPELDIEKDSAEETSPKESDETLMPPYAGFYEYYSKEMGIEMITSIELTKDNVYYMNVMGDLMAGKYEVNRDTDDFKIILLPSSDTEKKTELIFNLDDYSLILNYKGSELILENKTNFVGTYVFNLYETRELSKKDFSVSDPEIDLLINMVIEIDRTKYNIDVSKVNFIKGQVLYKGNGEIKLVPVDEHSSLNAIVCKIKNNKLYMDDPNQDFVLVFDKVN